MNSGYQETLDYLYGLVNFEHKRLDQYVAENITLERPRQLLAKLGNPQADFQAIHIAGTKGKGSVAAMSASVLRAAGYRVGLYTSPHLFDFRDRIRILTPEDADGRIGQDQLVELVQLLKPIVAQIADITWYEAVTALAFMHFAREQVDVAVVEVGLGGRLDATNVLNPLVSVITSLSLDHVALLGDTLAEIAAEKGGIIKPNTPVVTAPQAPEALRRLQEMAISNNAPMTIIGQEWEWLAVPTSKNSQRTERASRQQIILSKAPKDSFLQAPLLLTLALAGPHQQENCLVALATLDSVKSSYRLLSVEAVLEGLANVDWPGRLQMLHAGQEGPALLVDCAHNVDSATKLAYALSVNYAYRALWLVLGVTADKDVEGIMGALLPLAEGTIMTSSGHPRAATPSELVRMAHQLGIETLASPMVTNAVKQAWQLAQAEDLICVTGSIFVVGDLLNHWDSLKSELRVGDEAVVDLKIVN